MANNANNAPAARNCETRTRKYKIIMSTATMYSVNKIFELPERISLPKTMYSMKNLLTTSPPTVDPNGRKEFVALEERQEKILAQLEQLERKLQQMRNISSNPPKKAIEPIKPIKPIGMMRDIVIKANPQHPPLALSLFCNLLKKHLKIGAESFVHSSVGSPLDDQLKTFFSARQFAVSRPQSELFITLIWQNASDIDPAMIINPMSQVAVKGEVNILRYLSYYAPTGESDALRSTDVDNVLDLVHASVVHGTNKERQSVVRQLNSRLGKQPWVNGDSFSVADIAAWAAFKRNALFDDAPANVKKWALAVEKLN